MPEKPRCCVPTIRRLRFFQSYWQLLYSVIIILLANLLVDFVLPYHSIASYMGVLICSSACVLYYDWRVFPHEMVIEKDELPNASRLVQDQLLRLFRVVSTRGSTTVYRERLPELLTWDEARVEVTAFPDRQRVVGPGITLSWLYKQLQAAKRPI